MQGRITRKNIRKLVLLAVSMLIISGCTDEAMENSFSNDAENTTTTDVPSTTTYFDSEKSANYFGNTNANLVNSGLAAIQGDWIYYCTPEGLFKINVDGTGEQLIFSDSAEDDCIYSINVVGNWIYYENFIGGIRAQYKVDINGEGHQQIGDGRQTHVIGDTLYWFRGGFSL